MTITTTTTTTTPQLRESLTELFQKEELFSGVSQAQAWLEQFGREVLKEAAYEAVQNLLAASSEERRSRGQLILERAIVAQAAWLQLFELMAPCGRIDQLKKLTAAIRDKDSSPEEHHAARAAALTAFAEYSARRQEADELIRQITDLAREEAFVWAARTGSVTGNRGQSMGLHAWQVQVIDKVLADHGYREAVKSLRLTAERLDLLSRIFFGEPPKPTKPSGNGGGSASKSRSAKKAAKAARDRDLRAKMRGGRS